MRTNRLLTALFVVALATALAGPAAAGYFDKDRIEGSGNLETRTLDLAEFDAVDVGGAFDMAITIGDRQEVVLTIDDNLWDNLEAEVAGGTLDIGWDKSCEPDDGCRIDIVVRDLNALNIHGAADVEISDYTGDSFEFNVSGAAELEMEGTVDDLEITVSGAGEIDTRDLKAKSVEITVSGAGEAKVFASESFEGRVSGVGDISYWGDPDHEKTKVSGLGNIKKK